MTHTLIHIQTIGTYEHIGPDSNKQIVNELKHDAALDAATKRFVKRGIDAITYTRRSGRSKRAGSK
jgi:hypothetical protein